MAESIGAALGKTVDAVDKCFGAMAKSVGVVIESVCVVDESVGMYQIHTASAYFVQGRVLCAGAMAKNIDRGRFIAPAFA